VARPPAQARVLAVLAATLLGLASGCSGSDDPADPPVSDPSSSLLPLDDPSVTGPPDGVTVTDLDDGPVGLASVGDEVWAALASSGEVRTGDDTRIPVGEAPLRLVSTPDGVWVSVIGDGSIVRIDPRSGGVDLRTRLAPSGSEPEGLAFDGHRLWVVDQAHDRVLAVDPATGEVGDSVRVGDAPRLAAVGSEGLWVSAYGAGAVTLVQDGGPGRHRTRTQRLGNRCTTPQGLAEAAGVLWVACTLESRVVGLDARTLEVVTTFDDVGSADAVVADGDTAYVVGQVGPTVWAIDAASRTISEPLVLDDLGGVTENVDGAIRGDHLVVSHPNGLRLYDIPLEVLGSG
jgi:streptogramin lyase